MIDLYTWHTSNGRKVSIALEELELPYRVFPVDITAGEQSSRTVVLIEHLGRVSITTTEGAEIYVDGSFKGTTPLQQPLELSVGRHQLAIKKLGFNTWDNEIVVDANRTLPLSVILSPSY